MAMHQSTRSAEKKTATINSEDNTS